MPGDSMQVAERQALRTERARRPAPPSDVYELLSSSGSASTASAA